MMGSKNKSVSSSEKSQGGKDKVKKDKKDHSEKKDVDVFINEEQASKIIKSSKVITIQDLARQANVKISTANAFLKKSVVQGTVKKVGGFSGHYIYQPISQ
ncbi:MAG: MarR family transcriptional regulator [Candidatus Nitrosopelagicus sp.]|nr:MarR family transcriptional regulator [Candidatus Nitrosopelagicus sp.]MBT6645951.1 MarR family transcriptional regulator [Nitrososphaerota archaeon]MBT3761726.1 MarR family transcriptional regulator [Candidatus Nitrosopelagicus sp.]MBT4327501.1 MarR family transcriptional regulator [Candidatus Nitrosopelagicus sp.]MBT4455416.1 MarR family transcriptional regulator [Candidatus Nitrosopelagicus sp.]